MVQRPVSSSAPLRLVEPMEDWELVARCTAGDPAAQRALFERERSRVHRLLYRVVGSNAPMDDLLQDTFLQVFRSLPSFRGESSLRTWIDRCAVRVAYAHFARKSRAPQLECIQDEVMEAPSTEERASMREAVRRLYAELDRLEPPQRVAFTLFALENRPLREVARLTESTLPATKIRVWRARRALEKRAKEDPLLKELFAEDHPVAREVTR